MIETNSQISEADIKRFLYGEMTDREREEVEELLFQNDELFFEIADLENELVDLYTAGKLSGEERARFERSLETLPERRGKVANAAALQTYIADEKPDESPAEAKQGFWQKVSELFTLRTPALSFSAAGLLLLLTLSSLFLYLDNRRKADELARLQSENQTAWSRREAELQSQLTNSQQRETELKAEIDAEREASGDLADELDRETARRIQIENELERLRRSSNTTGPSSAQQSTPVIAFISLSPAVGIRGRPPVVQQRSVPSGTRRLAIRMLLPEPVAKGERFTARLNGTPIAQGLAARTSNGVSSVQIVVPTENLREDVNELSVSSTSGTEVGTYLFKVSRK